MPFHKLAPNYSDQVTLNMTCKMAIKQDAGQHQFRHPVSGEGSGHTLTIWQLKNGLIQWHFGDSPLLLGNCS